MDRQLVAGDVTTLSMRERDVLRLLALGHTNREIGTLLHISVRTAEFHRKNIQRKLNLTSRSQLVNHALTHGFLEDEPRPLWDLGRKRARVEELVESRRDGHDGEAASKKQRDLE